jgi:hypothetical protein
VCFGTDWTDDPSSLWRRGWHRTDYDQLQYLIAGGVSDAAPSESELSFSPL